MIHTKAEQELKERLQKRKKPLRELTHDEQRRKKDKASGRKRARYLQKQAQEAVKPDDKTIQTSFGTALTDALLEKPETTKKRRQPEPDDSEAAHEEEAQAEVDESEPEHHEWETE